MSVGNGHQARQNSIAELILVKCASSSFLARTPGLYRKKCKACQDDNHFNFKECKRCGGVLDIQSPGRPRWTTASEGNGVRVTCS